MKAAICGGATARAVRYADHWLPPALCISLLTCVLGLLGSDTALAINLATIALIGAAPFALASLLGHVLGRRTFGLDTVALIFIPSFLVFHGWIGAGIAEQTRTIFEATDILSCFTTVVIFGSVFGMERQALPRGLRKIFLPLLLASILAAAAAVLVGMAFQIAPSYTLLYMAAPIMAGGINAGALPLAMEYASGVGAPPDAMLSQMISAIVIANACAILLAGMIAPAEHRLHPTPIGRPVSSPNEFTIRSRASDIGYAGLILILVYLAGKVLMWLFGFPAPLTVLLVAAIFQLLDLLPSRIREAHSLICGWCAYIFTRPILFAVGVYLTPWSTLQDGFTFAHIATIGALVGALAGMGLIFSRCVGFKCIDGALITLCRAAMGGTGDVAILSAARRLDLMPYAQIATRIGGAATISAASVASQHLL